MDYKELKNFLIECSNSYYKDSISKIPDQEFDQKLKELEKMEQLQGFPDSDSPTQKPGSDLNDSNSIKHRRPMLSLENTYTLDEAFDWFDKMKETTRDDIKISVEYKFDGGSASIFFKNGKVEKALTRGTGEEGEDITENVKLLDWSTIEKDFSGEVRGELIISKSGFEKLNKEKIYQNPRNLLSGSMKLLDREEFKKRAVFIKFFAYWNEDTDTGFHSKNIEILERAGFSSSFKGMKFATNKEELEKALNLIEKEKETLDFEIDGAVMKLDSTKYWEKIGSTSKFPRWAKAFKYKQEQVISTVRNITFEVGRTGKITPLCWFDPIFLDGSTIEKATLNNEDFMRKMDIGIGDEVLVQKAACIIPQIVEVVNRKSRKKEVIFPNNCPVCDSKLEKESLEHVDFFCINNSCPARVCGSISNFTHAMKIDGFAEVVIERIHKLGILNSISDIYRLKENEVILNQQERFGKKMVSNLLDNIEKSKSQSLSRLIEGLGIRNVGPKMAKSFAKNFKDLKKLAEASREELKKIEDVGEIVADSVIDFFSDENNKKIIQELKNFGLNFKEEQIKEKQVIDLSGKSFCITGSLSLKREDYINLIESYGGKVISSVSSRTNYLITNDSKTMTTKNIAAKELGIPILDEEELLKLLQKTDLIKK